MQPSAGSVSPEDLQFARVVVDQGLCTQDKVDECVSFIGRLISQGVTPVPRLAELLVRKGYLTPADATLRPASAGDVPAVDSKLPPEVALSAQDPTRVLGKYVKVSRLGSGGMGEVWKGWDRELGRWVALKFLHSADAAQESRLRREAQTAAGLHHPHIASVYEVGVKNAAPFIAMQYIDGQTLSSFPRKDRRVIVELVRDAALAVQHAHSQGVIHRDLKPANIMVEHGHVFVMDFGLAKATTLEGSHSVSGSIVGTPAYMSPEQARGRTGEIASETDVYSLGATLYELLTDRPPFQADDIYALLGRVVDDDPPPLRRINASIERDLETIVLKCLDKRPARRYRTARELAEELDRWLRGEPIHAHPPSTFYHMRKYVGRRKAPVAMGVAGLAAVAVVLAIMIPSWLHERTLKELGPLRTQIAVVREWIRQPFRKPEEIRRALQTEIDGVSAYIKRHPELPQGHFIRAQAHFYLGDLRSAERDAREALRLDPGFLPAWTLLGRVQLEDYAGLRTADSADKFKVREELARSRLEEARRSLQRGRGSQEGRSDIEAWGLARTRDDAVSATLGDALHLYYVNGSPNDALKRLDEAHRRSPAEEYLLWGARWLPAGQEKTLRIQATIDMAPHYAAGHLERANNLAAARTYDEAVQAYSETIARDPWCAAAYVGRGLVRGYAEEYKAAIDDFTEALRINERDTSAYVYRAAVRSMVAEVSETEQDAAIADCDKALEIHPTSIGALINRSIARRNKKDFAGALDDLARVLALNPKSALAWTNQAGVLQEMKRGKEAFDALARAIELDGTSVESYRLRGTIRQEVDPQGAVLDFTRAIEESQGKSPAFIAELYAERCLSRLLHGDRQGGMADAREALRLDPEGASPNLQHGNALLAQGDAAGAIRAYDRSIRSYERSIFRRTRFNFPWTGRAQARLSLGQVTEAIADATRAIEMEPEDFAAYLTRAMARERQKDSAGAEKDYTKVVEIKPNTDLAYLRRSYCRAALGRFPEAAADADQAHLLAPPGSPQKELARKYADAFRAGKMP